jgi:uncharacterized protein YkwD
MLPSARTTAIVAALSTLALTVPAAGIAKPNSSSLTSWRSLAAPRAASSVKTGAAPRARVTAALESQVLTGLNGVRAQHGLKALRKSSALASAAYAHSVQMAKGGYFSHSSANGEAFWKRIRRFYKQASFRYWAVGENLLWSSPNVDASGAIEMWMNSPEHRANMLDRDWREVGLAAVHVTVAPGAFQGLEVTIVTADFGVRR